ncbi:MAG: IS110 family transposase [Spirochaetes bacterium]|jgi:transposase|uniref:Transposase n=1 Tax=Halanaerobium congolense TaxID=54121 RepID=A0A318E071_9FIRM|nr:MULTISPECIES: IS110 family transposase [Bacteria]NLV68048.1 IS110 family transposase [Spirochaetota bacterium]PXV62043.1 transposase [Halanaerobium congolense]TDX37672.1 transposase [Halanaerobium congolense]
MKKSSIFVGLDVHKNSIEIAIAEAGRNGEVRSYGKIDGSLGALDKVIRKLVSKGYELHFVYEAGPCGYEIYRHLAAQGFDCMVVAPAMIPKQSGNRIKNDHRDAQMLARLHRAGELSAVFVPFAEDEAMRDLTRSREDAKLAEKKAKQRILAFLLRHGHHFNGRSHWSQAHLRWIAGIKMPHPAQQIVLQEYVDAFTECTRRVERLTGQIQQLLPQWRMVSVVKAYQSLRGVSLIVAATTVAEIGDMTRFTSPVELMSYLGLVPSEHSSGEKTKRGAITKTGNGHVRRVLVEASWAYRLPARVSRELRKRQEGLSQEICDISWKAQLRLCARYKRMLAKGKPKQVIVTAIARELCAFMWAIAHEVEFPIMA